MKINKNWFLTGLLMVMLVVAGWQYWQVRQQAELQATGVCQHSRQDECEREDGCRWLVRPGQPQGGSCVGDGPDETLSCPPGTHDNGNCVPGQAIHPPCCSADASASPVPSCNWGNWGTCFGGCGGPGAGTQWREGNCDPWSELRSCDLPVCTTGLPSPVPSRSPRPSASPIVVSPNPSVSPSPSPSPSPLPLGHAGLVIRKFKDDDKDGNWDNNETGTGQEWQFQYRISSDPWQDYTTSADTGWGGVVDISRGTKVEVREVEQPGWTNTTGLTLIKILDEEKTYYFDFGNFKAPGVMTAETPVRAPETGLSSQWQIWAGLATLGIALQFLAIML